jgi:hypothetical protein
MEEAMASALGTKPALAYFVLFRTEGLFRRPGAAKGLLSSEFFGEFHLASNDR